MDSLQRIRNKVTVANILLLGQSFQSERKKTSLSIPSLFELLSFNPAEGWVLYPAFVWTKRLDPANSGRKTITIAPNLRYGFANKHFNAHLTVGYSFGKQNATTVSLSAGKRVFQFNNNSPVSDRSNSISCLISEENRIKSYEAKYFRGSFRRDIGNGFTLTAGFQFQDRSPLENRTNFSWRDKKNREYTPNYPFEIMTENIKPHQVFMGIIGLRWQPGNRFLRLLYTPILPRPRCPVF